MDLTYIIGYENLHSKDAFSPEVVENMTISTDDLSMFVNNNHEAAQSLNYIDSEQAIHNDMRMINYKSRCKHSKF